jgi:small-conductance mechanosensitive channel
MPESMPATGIRDWGEAMMTSATGALALLLAAVPKIIGFVIILLVGWFIAGLIAKAIAAVLRKVNFNEMATRSGFSGFVDKMGVRCDAAGFIGETGKWFVRLLALIVAFDALGLPAVSQVLHQLLLWIPNLIVALVILVIAGLAANALSNLVRGATAQAGFSNPNFVAGVARVAVWGFGIILAVNQIGVAETLVNTLFMGFVGALALALGLAFGLGGRDTASEIVSDWYQQGKESAPKIAEATDVAQQEMGGKDPTTMHRSGTRPRY